jgi:hypothetical protein
VRHAEQESTRVAVAVADSSLVEAQSNMNIAERYMISQLSGADDTSDADDDGHEDEAASSWCMFIVMSWLSLSLSRDEDRTDGLPVRRVMILISKDCLSVAQIRYLPCGKECIVASRCRPLPPSRSRQKQKQKPKRSNHHHGHCHCRL